MQAFKLGEIKVEVVLKDIKNLHLSVYPPNGRVHISAPHHMDIDTIRMYTISKLAWIKKQQRKFREQAREIPREYINKESHFYLGRRYMMKIVEHNMPPDVAIKHNIIELRIRPNADAEKKQAILEQWYRNQLKMLVPPIIKKWEKIMKLSLNECAIKKMRTKWGTCNSKAKRIWLNLELIKKPIDCIEYIIVHEMIHLIERKHNERFIILMDKYLPEWKQLRMELNRFPISHTDWKY